MRLRPGSRGYADDAQTLTSRNPDALSLDLELYRKLMVDNDELTAARARGPFREGALVFQGDTKGACAIVQLQWGARQARRREPLWLMLSGIVLVSAIAAGLGFLAIFRPLARRIGQLRTAAEQVGSSEYQSVKPHAHVILDHDQNHFHLVVSDDGPGVPPAEIPRLGERTFRSDEARERDPRGSGLGLAITAEVCRRCRWTLRFEAEQPVGLRVCVAGVSDN